MSWSGRRHSLTVLLSFAVLLAVGCDPGAPVAQSTSGDIATEPVNAAEPEKPRVVLQTALGDIELEVFLEEAPVSATNFLAYVNDGLYDGAAFYRVVRAEHGDGDPSAIQVVQGGLLADSMRGSQNTDDLSPAPRPPIAHETTDQTRLRNERGVVSYARLAPGTASSEFFVNMKDNTALDTGDTRRQPDGQGYATFARVVAGMDVLEQIHVLETSAEAGPEMLRGQILSAPVIIRRAYRR